MTAEANNEAVFYVYATEENGIAGQAECEAQGFEWRNAAWNFDNFGNALQSVLIIFTYNGWQEIMFNAINARYTHAYPARHQAPLSCRRSFLVPD